MNQKSLLPDKHSPKRKKLSSAQKSGMKFIGNPNAYFIHYKLLPKPGELTRMNHILVHRCPFSRVGKRAAMLDAKNPGDGIFLEQFYMTYKSQMKRYLN